MTRLRYNGCGIEFRIVGSHVLLPKVSGWSPVTTCEKTWTLGDWFLLHKFVHVLLYSSNCDTTEGNVMNLHVSWGEEVEYLETLFYWRCFYGLCVFCATLKALQIVHYLVDSLYLFRQWVLSKKDAFLSNLKLILEPSFCIVHLSVLYKMVIFPNKNAYKILVGRPEESLFVDLGRDGRIAEMDLTESGSLAWTEFI